MLTRPFAIIVVILAMVMILVFGRVTKQMDNM
jgi:hypothetical protein